MESYQILLVDDRPTDLRRWAGWLEKTGYQVLTSKTADKAVSLYKENHIDLLVIDLNLDEIRDDGNEGFLLLLDLLKIRFSPIIILTAFPIYKPVRRTQLHFPINTLSQINFVDKSETKDAFLEVVKDMLPSENIFIVHGRNKEIRAKVKDFLKDELRLNPIILDEQPGTGNSIMEKLEEYIGKASLAIVLITPDDIGALKASPDLMSSRGRQNVIFELGYLRGRFGARWVITLKALVEEENDIELPSDYSGIEYILLGDNDLWKAKLVKQMQYLGYKISYNFQ